MALRSLDNTLPISTPERPRKQAKLGAGPENQNRAVALPSQTETIIQYISSHNLNPIPDPDATIPTLIQGLESGDWIKLCDSLNIARRFSLHHPTFLLPNLENVMLVMVKAMKNPRSALCKTSIMAASDLFNAFGDRLLLLLSTATAPAPAFDQLMLQLLLKASQDKRFVCQEADKALRAMVASLTPLPLLHKLRAYVTHANLRIRAKAAISISHCVSNMGLKEMEEFGLVPLLQMAADLLNDRLPEAREAARSITLSLFQGGFTEETWQCFCQSNLAPIDAQSVIKIVPSLTC